MNAYFIFGLLGGVILVIALAWFLVLRRLDEGNFEVGGPLHPPWTRKAVALGNQDEHALIEEWSEERQVEREEHAGTAAAIGETRDRNAARAWGG